MTKNVNRSDFLIGLLLTIIFIFKIFSYQNKSLYWDEATYVSIGKYLFSFGQFGFIEAFRPIVWPIVLGFIWKMNLDVFFIGMILQLAIGLGTILLVYLVGTKIFNQAVGLLAALLFSFSPAYYYWNNTLLTDIPSACIGLWAVYCVLNKQYFLSGLIGIFAFLIRFTQALTVDLIFLYVLAQSIQSRQWKPLLHFVIGIVLLLVPYFIYNQWMHGHFLASFIDSKLGYSQYTSPWGEGILLVLSTLFTNESWVFLFILPALVYIFTKRFKYEALLILAVGVAQFIWVGKLPVEIVRYLTACLPYFYILAALGIYVFYSYLSSHFRLISKIFILVVIMFVLQLFSRFIHVPFVESPINGIQRYVINNEETLKGKQIWMSNPRYFAFVDLKIHEILYYPRVNIKKLQYLNTHLSEADYVFLDSTNMNCNREPDACEVEKWKLISRIQAEFQEELLLPMPDKKNFQAVFKNKRLK